MTAAAEVPSGSEVSLVPITDGQYHEGRVDQDQDQLLKSWSSLAHYLPPCFEPKVDMVRFRKGRRLATQPFLDYCTCMLSGTGVNCTGFTYIHYELLILCRLMGLFIPANEVRLQEATTAIATDKATSGSKLNLKKSIITPILVVPIPDWLKNSST